MPDVFTKAKCPEVMSRIRPRGNQATEIALVKIFQRHKITGWRRQIQIGGTGALLRDTNIKAVQQHRPTFRRPNPAAKSLVRRMPADLSIGRQ